jgi:hypothetical protein
MMGEDVLGHPKDELNPKYGSDSLSLKSLLMAASLNWTTMFPYVRF